MQSIEEQLKRQRLAALRRFAISITLLNILGHFFLGFEQSWAHPIVALGTAYALEIFLELVDASCMGRPVQFKAEFSNLVDFLLPAHIAGLAVSMLLYANELLWPIAFASAAAICSKAIFRAPVGSSQRHFLNPSNFGISLTLVLFPFVSISPPYHFTENLVPLGDFAAWILPVIIVISGSILHARLAKRIPLIVAWFFGFIAQALLRTFVFDSSILGALLPMTGVAFILYSFYMIPDPATTPAKPSAQIAFGSAVALVYGLLVSLHIVFGLFFALTIACAARGLSLYLHAWLRQRASLAYPIEAISVIRDASK